MKKRASGFWRKSIAGKSNDENLNKLPPEQRKRRLEALVEETRAEIEKAEKAKSGVELLISSFQTQVSCPPPLFSTSYTKGWWKLNLKYLQPSFSDQQNQEQSQKELQNLEVKLQELRLTLGQYELQLRGLSSNGDRSSFHDAHAQHQNSHPPNPFDQPGSLFSNLNPMLWWWFQGNISISLEGEIYATALFDFEATADDELSFSEGQRIKILEQSETGWWLASLNGQEGWIPSNYIHLDL